MGFNTINVHFKKYGIKDNGYNSDIIYTFNLTEPPGYMKVITPTKVLYRNVTKDGIEYIEFSARDEHGKPIDFNGDVLSFTLHIV